jgi:hypothetical protein
MANLDFIGMAVPVINQFDYIIDIANEPQQAIS